MSSTLVAFEPPIFAIASNKNGEPDYHTGCTSFRNDSASNGFSFAEGPVTLRTLKSVRPASQILHRRYYIALLIGWKNNSNFSSHYGSARPDNRNESAERLSNDYSISNGSPSPRGGASTSLSSWLAFPLWLGACEELGRELRGKFLLFWEVPAHSLLTSSSSDECPHEKLQLFPS